MAIPPCGTFYYLAVVPETFGSAEQHMPAADYSGAATFSEDDPLRDNRLLGLKPVLEVGDGVLSLVSSGRDRALVSRASFGVDTEVPRILQAGDSIRVLRTATGDLALSILRDGALCVAVGAVTYVPLGRGVSATGKTLYLIVGPAARW